MQTQRRAQRCVGNGRRCQRSTASSSSLITGSRFANDFTDAAVTAATASNTTRAAAAATVAVTSVSAAAATTLASDAATTVIVIPAANAATATAAADNSIAYARAAASHFVSAPQTIYFCISVLCF